MHRRTGIAFLFMLAACSDEKDPIVTAAEPTAAGSYSASVVGLPARPAVRGTVNATSYGSYFIADASFTGLNAGTSYQWKTYFGNCAAKVVQMGQTAIPSAYPAIVADASGAGAARATVSSRFKADSIYSVRLYTVAVLTPAPVDTVFVACGDFTKR